MEQDDTLISLASPDLQAAPTLPVDTFLRDVLSEDNYDKLDALAEAYGITVEGILNVAISDQFDSKIASMRDASG